MKRILPKKCSRTALAGLLLAASLGAGHAAQYVVSTFNSAADIAPFVYQNWNGSPGAFSWSTNDAGGSPTSGSFKMATDFNQTNNGGAYRYGLSVNLAGYTALEYDVKVDAASGLDQYGNAADFKLGVSTTGAYNYHANDLNVSIVPTNNGWMHVVLSALATGGSEWNDIKEVFIQQYDNNYTNSKTAVIYLDNIKFTRPDPTYPDYNAFNFDIPDFMNGVRTNWYGNPVFVEYATNNAPGSGSGSMHVVGTFAPNDNNFVAAIPFDTNFDQSFTVPSTNIINGRHYASVELDVLWDTNLTDVEIASFNGLGDISGFPLGLLINSGGGGGGQVQAFGGTAAPVPNTASNGQWFHLVFPLNGTSPGIDQTTGLWLKKWGGNTNFTGSTVGFYVDNVVFKGAAIGVPSPTATVSKPTPGLQTVSTGTGGNPPYDRESLSTFFDTFTFVDQPTPVSYSMNIGWFPPASFSGYAARIYLVPSGAGINGTAAEPDWTYPTVLFAEIQRSGTGSTVQLHAKTNAPASNGNYYSQPNPIFTTTSKIEGNWVVKITQNTNVFIMAPDGSSTNLPFPLSFTSADVQANFINAGMFVYYGSIPNGTANEGQRVVFSSFGFTNANSASTFFDNFLTDTALDLNNGSSGIWFKATDTSRTDGVYLLSQSTKFFLDWTVNGGADWTVETNTDIRVTGNWGTNGPITATATLIADHYHADVDATNLPPTGNLFFRLMHP